MELEKHCSKMVPVQEEFEKKVSTVHLVTHYDSDPPSPADDSDIDPDYEPLEKIPKKFNIGLQENFALDKVSRTTLVTVDVHESHSPNFEQQNASKSAGSSKKQSKLALKRVATNSSLEFDSIEVMESDIEIAMNVTCETSTLSTDDEPKRVKKKVANPSKWQKNLSKKYEMKGNNMCQPARRL